MATSVSLELLLNVHQAGPIYLFFLLLFFSFFFFFSFLSFPLPFLSLCPSLPPSLHPSVHPQTFPDCVVCALSQAVWGQAGPVPPLRGAGEVEVTVVVIPTASV